MARCRGGSRCVAAAAALAVTLLLAAGGGAEAAVRVCGTHNVSAVVKQKVQADLNDTMQVMLGTTDQFVAGQRLAANAQDASADSGARSEAAAAPATGISVPVYVHVLREGTGTTQGNVPASAITAQIAQLNAAFAQTGATFTLAATTRTTNASWYRVEQDSQEWVEMTNTLHQGGAGDLNLYLPNLTFPLLGWSQFPFSYAAEPLQDGVFVDSDSLPGGDLADFNLGNTAVHETGHWLGLFHPFQGGCSMPNDYVADTPESAMPEYYCVSAPADTCPDNPGKDVFKNYMDYPPDRCMDTFTAGQATRLAVSYNTYRTGGPAYSPNGAPAEPTPSTSSTSAPSRVAPPDSCSDPGQYRAPSGCAKCLSSKQPFTKTYTKIKCVQPTTLSAQSTACTNLVLPVAIRNNANTKQTVSCVNPNSKTASIYLPLKTAAAPFVSATKNYYKTTLRLGSLREIPPRSDSNGNPIYLERTVNGAPKMLMQFTDKFGTIKAAAGKSLPLSGVLNHGPGLLAQCFTAYVKVCS